jgi:hypothetical protein
MNRRNFLQWIGAAGALSLVPASLLKFNKTQHSWWNDNLETVRIGHNSAWGYNLFIMQYNKYVGAALVNASTEQWKSMYIRKISKLVAAPNATAKDIELEILSKRDDNRALIMTVGAIVDYGIEAPMRHHPRIGDLIHSKSFSPEFDSFPLRAKQYAKEMIWNREYLKKNKIT